MHECGGIVRTCQGHCVAVRKVSSATLGAYSYTFTASGTPAPSFTVSFGPLPTGLTLTSGGVLAGTSTAAGTGEFTVTAHRQ